MPHGSHPTPRGTGYTGAVRLALMLPLLLPVAAAALSACSDDDGGGGSWPGELYLAPLDSELTLQLVEQKPAPY